MKNTWISNTALAVTLALSLGLTACGASADAGAQAPAAEQGEEQTEVKTATNDTAEVDVASVENSAVKEYRIATEGAYAPYNYIGEDGQPDGYDIAVSKAVDELIPDVTFTYQAVEWSSIFAGLEAGRYDLIVSQAAKTPEREEKYLFGNTAYAWDLGAIAFVKGRDDIHSLEDLSGKTLTVAVGSSNANVIETWNASHNNAVEVVYGDGDITKALLDVQEGRVDATLVSPVTGNKIVSEQGLNIDFALRNDEEPKPVFWLYANTPENEELKEKVDQALQQLVDSGKLGEISKEYLGEDYSSLEAVQSRITQ
ncbi:MAG: transporter substrate-binding domain-containing protein [Lachnospiraceae bacterium]|nr:transporter substrate-binding domain-containing protein [Lachnospiraceae bacterium]